MDYDIVVVGAGPAGLTAAVRAAWLAAPAATYKASILILEASDQPGGLSQWKPLVINTPGVFFTKRELKKLVRACEYFGVEFRFERVQTLHQGADQVFEIGTTAGSYRSLSTIVATGCKLGHPGENRLFHRNRILWFGSNAELNYILEQLEADDAIQSICLCGAEGVVETRRYIGTPRSLVIRTYAEPPYSRDIPAEVGKGHLVSIGVDPDQQRLRLRFEHTDESIDEFTVDVMIVDFNAYEATATTTRFLDASVRKQPNAFLDPDRSMATGTPGLYSAGDVNGVPFCVAKAMSDGVIAGYSAYEYVCLRRTGVKPNLFPYYPYEI